MLWIVVSLPIVLFLWLAYLGDRSQKVAKTKLLHEGARAAAEIVGYEDTDDGLFVRYRFTPHGKSQTIECTMQMGFLDERLPEGTKIPVRYMRSYPSISMLEPYSVENIQN